MSYVMAMNTDMSNWASASSEALIRCGGNGDVWGDSEYYTGPDDSDTTDGYTQWDDDLSDGFDTAWVPVQIAASSGGTTLNVSGANDGALTSTDAATNGIHEVDLRAVAEVTGSEAIWSGLVVQFYKGGQMVESDSVPTLDARVTDASQSQTQEASAIVTPTGTGDDAVVITGVMRLTFPGTDGPASNQMFCQALIR